tara:strand:- start:175 stop:894 length:720 start_codon:yes stop_codon:yes gene_type:complete
MESNKIVLVTGGSKNLGKYIANFFLNLNCHVICVSKNTLSNLKSDNYLCDLSNKKKSQNFFNKLKKKYKKIDFIISCAGLSKRSFKAQENQKDWQIAMNNNFYCFSNLVESYCSVYKFKPTKIVAISSIAGGKITKAPITYSVAKAALNFYAQIKAKDLAKYKIRLNIIMPGNILMENNNWYKKIKKDKKKIKKYIKSQVPLNEFCNPKQIAEFCEYLFNSSGDNITGSKFIIDGGESL